jgi:hypothetical protein
MNIFKNIRKKLKCLKGQNDVPLETLFPTSFMRKYTVYNSIEDMLENCDYTVESLDDLADINDAEWDRFVQKTTKFNNWQDMLLVASREWVGRRLEE